MNSRDANVPTVLTQEVLVKKLEGQTLPKISPNDLEAAIQKEVYHVFDGSCLTVCVLTLQNGFTVSGESACASPAMFDAEIGRTIARRNAKDKLWSLLGYELKTKLSLIEKVGPASGAIFSLGSEVTTHVGTKVIHATMMNRARYNALRGWSVPADENPLDEGYLVQYADGGALNVPGFTGYVSWSPKGVFERAYGDGYKAPAETFYDRLVKEVSDLRDKVEKLRAYIDSGKAAQLPIHDYSDLREQLSHMVAYLLVLEKRERKLKPV